MKYLKLISLICIATIGCLFISCEETAEVDEYANWKERNIEFIDSIAQVAEVNADGKWMKLLSFKLDATDVNGNAGTFDTDDYIYCHVTESGNGTTHPLFTDSVAVNYRGRLIPTLSVPEGKVFDQSFKGELNPATNKPARFNVGGVIVGWSTALQHMAKGDIWRVYIPAPLAYGSKKQTDIPAHSALIFDINLVNFTHVGTPLPNM
jgi:FKBP-type peptidyl-prolyl cis-trans isomerase FklB